MNDYFPQYTPEYINGVMSLRKPQEKSLQILHNILSEVKVSKDMDIKDALTKVNKLYPTCTDFERDFMSLTFALATGVGKTRLMGVFIAYLYTNHNIKNFFVVAPGTTVYEKLKKDLGDPTSEKYVFKGLGCFNNAPTVIVDTDYNQKQFNVYDDGVKIFIYNIDKFNKEKANMRKVIETLGASFYQYLSSLNDLVLIMDESHHYRAEKGESALNELKPILGLELTATPFVTNGNKQELFKNVVYEYSLKDSIMDGYTRTPFAVTRTDIDFYNFGDEQMDKLMILDGITCHEKTRSELEAYSQNHNLKKVKPFMLVVCKDTEHAAWVEKYIKSLEFRDGYYANKTIIVHSKQKGVESEINTQLLLEVEKPDNPVEIVIHVNMLKEGWDVNNLYTIVPLRTATSKILREQMVGRGLRLPYGKRTGETNIDAVMLTAHNKFQEIIEEAQKGDSIFKAGNIIKVNEIEKTETKETQVVIDDLVESDSLKKAYENTGVEKSDEMDKLLNVISEAVVTEANNVIQNTKSTEYTEEKKEEITQSVKTHIKEESKKQRENEQDLGKIFEQNEYPIKGWIDKMAEQIHVSAAEKFIPIPRLKITDAGIEQYVFVDFDLDLSDFNYVPIKNDILKQSLTDPEDVARVRGEEINFDAYNPKKVILDEIRKKPEIDYENANCATLLKKLIKQLCSFLESKYSITGMQNVVMMYKKDIANKIYKQMMSVEHFFCENGFIKEEIVGAEKINKETRYTYEEKVHYNSPSTKSITKVLYTGFKKGVFPEAKFDSEPELTLAKALEIDKDVENWLRPAPEEFDFLKYNRGKGYEPDFVVETKDVIYLVEVKGENKLEDADVLAKKKRAVQYCEAATHWNRLNGYKDWKHLFIPSMQIQSTSTIDNLSKRFVVESKDKNE